MVFQHSVNHNKISWVFLFSLFGVSGHEETSCSLNEGRWNHSKILEGLVSTKKKKKSPLIVIIIHSIYFHNLRSNGSNKTTVVLKLEGDYIFCFSFSIRRTTITDTEFIIDYIHSMEDGKRDVLFYLFYFFWWGVW